MFINQTTNFSTNKRVKKEGLFVVYPFCSYFFWLFDQNTYGLVKCFNSKSICLLNLFVLIMGHSNNTFLGYFRSPPPMCHLVTLPPPPPAWRDNFHFTEHIAFKRSLGWNFGDTVANPPPLPPPLECHVLFEWPLMYYGFVQFQTNSSNAVYEKWAK